MMNRENRYELRYVSPVNGNVTACYPRSEEKKNENIEFCKERGIKVISCKKLYPFSTEKNQHNFEPINNICFNRMHDMESGEIEWDEAEYDRLSEMREKAERFFGLTLPVAWLTWEDWKEAKELASMAVLHRQEACIANGRPDLVTYC